VIVSYSSNNSGGYWWLDDDNWLALEKAGWNVDWMRDKEATLFHKPGEERWLGALAQSASREGLSLRDAITEWEDVTHADSRALGCSCCGVPHSFTFLGDNGEHDYYSPEFPEFGEEYGDGW
jgi:hypothetical protein